MYLTVSNALPFATPLPCTSDQSLQFKLHDVSLYSATREETNLVYIISALMYYVGNHAVLAVYYSRPWRLLSNLHKILWNPIHCGNHRLNTNMQKNPATLSDTASLAMECRPHITAFCLWFSQIPPKNGEEWFLDFRRHCFAIFRKSDMERVRSWHLHSGRT